MAPGARGNALNRIHEATAVRRGVAVTGTAALWNPVGSSSLTKMAAAPV
jgi:hypothetical protein